MFDTITDYIPRDPALPERAWRLDVFERILDGRLYDVLPFAFHDERDGAGEYIPLRKRKPSVRYPLARIVVDDSLSLVFSEGHFPVLDCEDDAARAALRDVIAEAGLNAVMQEAALRGSVGSVVIHMRVLRERVFFSVLQSKFLTPQWDPQEPDTLLGVTEKFKVRGAELAAQGFEVADPGASYWFMRSWDDEREVWFKPWPVYSNTGPVEDEQRSSRHGLGFVPLVWVRNLPGGDAIDGACTFRAAVEIGIEIDYQLSQAGRGLKYSSDPTLLIREPAGSEQAIVRSAGNALVVSEKGDARLLEIGGTASAAVIEYVRTLREFALEGVHGNRASPERLSAAQSGRALEMMNQGLIWLADNLRVSYGDALLRLARMVARASNRYDLTVFGEPVAPISPATRWTLKWPRWHAPTAEDRERDARTLGMLREAGQISRMTALKSIADVYDIPDVDAELQRIGEEEKQ